MHQRCTIRKIKALRERGRKMARARWDLDRARRKVMEPELGRQLAEAEAINLPRRQGDPIGALQWTEFATGRVHRWTVIRGDRADRFILRSPDGRATRSHGWTWILDHLRPFLCLRRAA